MAIIGNLPYTFTNGTTADATQVMANLNAIINGVNSATTGAAPIPSVQQDAYTYVADSGTVNNLIIAMTPSPATYTDGLWGRTKAANTSTSTTVTVKFGTLGTKTVVIDQAGTVPPLGCIISGMHYIFEYDSTQDKCILLNPSLPAIPYAADTGTVNAMVITVGPAISAYRDGQSFLVKMANTNTSNAPTLNVNGLGAKTCFGLPGMTVLNPGTLVANNIYQFVYNSTTGGFSCFNASESFGSFTLTGTGFTSSPTCSVSYRIDPQQYIFNIYFTTTLTGTSNATTFTGTGVPAALASTTTQFYAIRGQDNTVQLTSPAMVQFGTSTWSFFKDFSGGAWTNAGTKSIAGGSSFTAAA